MGGLIFNAPCYIKIDHKARNAMIKLADNRELHAAVEEKVMTS
jgi:hypothetical protein